MTGICEDAGILAAVIVDQRFSSFALQLHRRGAQVPLNQRFKIVKIATINWYGVQNGISGADTNLMQDAVNGFHRLAWSCREANSD